MAAKKRPRLSDEQRARKRAEDREYTRKAVQQLQSSEGWQRWLSTRASFTTYSLNNQLLIAMQRPTARRVATFKRWLSLGYCVTKRPDDVPEGEWAIRIWQPCSPSKAKMDAWRDAGSIPEERPRTYFKLGAVFGDDQVAELPPPAEPQPLQCPIRELEGDDLAPVLPALIALGSEIGSAVSFAAIDGDARGYYRLSTKAIVIEQQQSINAQAATLVHELAHALVRADRQDDDPTLDYASEELVVESVAFTVIRALGIDADRSSIPYLASWAESSDIAVIEQTAELIDRLAKRIEAALADAGEAQASDQDSETQDRAA